MEANVRRIILVVLDGLGDLPHPALGGKTPLEAAVTPHLDRLAQDSRLGLLYPVRKGVAPESDAGVLGLLGYDPEAESPGRGVLEAMGIGLDLAPGDVALRFNFATADSGGRIIDQRVGRNLSTAEATALADAVSKADLLHDLGIQATVRATVGHRGVLRLRPLDGGALSADVTNSDPFYLRAGRAGHAVKPKEPRVLEVAPQTNTPAALRTAQALNRFSERATDILLSHPVNGARVLRGVLVANRLIVRDAGNVAQGLPGFQARHGISGAAITEMPVERGIALLLGLSDRFVGPMGADVPLALRDRAEAVRTAAGTPDIRFVYVHLKGPDVPGHDGEAQRKREIIEEIDAHFFGPLLKGFDLTSITIAITADHSTPCILKGHSDDPVPLLVTGNPPPTAHPSVRYTEACAREGTLGVHRGVEIIPFLLHGVWKNLA